MEYAAALPALPRATSPATHRSRRRSSRERLRLAATQSTVFASRDPSPSRRTSNVIRNSASNQRVAYIRLYRPREIIVDPQSMPQDNDNPLTERIVPWKVISEAPRATP